MSKKNSQTLFQHYNLVCSFYYHFLLATGGLTTGGGGTTGGAAFAAAGAGLGLNVEAGFVGVLAADVFTAPV